jgi:hypothetical protein
MIVGGIKVKFSDQDVTTRLEFVNLGTEKISQRKVRCNVDYEKEWRDGNINCLRRNGNGFKHG